MSPAILRGSTEAHTRIRKEGVKMSMVIIALICLLDTAARTYITSEGAYYESIGGKVKWIIRK